MIPDFVPVLGYLDDLLVIPASIALTVRMVPAPAMSELRRGRTAAGAEPNARLGGRGDGDRRLDGGGNVGSPTLLAPVVAV